jgi:hypothetical protein
MMPRLLNIAFGIWTRALNNPGNANHGVLYCVELAEIKLSRELFLRGGRYNSAAGCIVTYLLR